MEIFRADADILKPKVVDPFYKETMHVWKNLTKKYVVNGVKSTVKQHLFFNPWIVNEDGEVLKPPVQLPN